MKPKFLVPVHHDLYNHSIIQPREEISGPLGADAYLGLSSAEIKRVTPLETMTAKFVLKQSLTPKPMGRKIEPNIFKLVSNNSCQ